MGSRCYRSIAALGAVLLLPICVAQQQKNPPAPDPPVLPALKVSLGQEISTNVTIGSMFRPMRCGHEGSIYVRVTALDKLRQTLGAPIYRIEPDGKSTVFELDKMPDAAGKEVDAFAFAVDRAGGVHAVVRTLELKQDGIEAEYIASFSTDGKYRSRVEIDKKYRPTRFVALSNGNFYLTGLYARDTSLDATSPPRSFTVLLDANGKLIRDMKQPGDDEVQKDSKISFALVENAAIQFGDAWEGPDGLLYMFRAGAPTRVQVFTASGSFVKAIVLRSPFPESYSDMMGDVSGNFAAAVFGIPELDERGRRKRQPANFVVYDSNTGEAMFALDFSNIHAPVACVHGDEVVILKPAQTGKYAIIRGQVGR